MDTLIITTQLILSLSILVTLHECGHFFPAIWFKTRVEKFYLFFDPWFSLWKTKKGDTEYGIGWLPLGGYVKISGMIDESMDKAHLEQEPQAWEFRSKPAWQRLIIMLGGVTVNFILGMVLFAIILFTWGETYIPNSEIKYGVHVDSLGYELGLREGDQIVSIGDYQFDKFNPTKFKLEIIINDAKSYRVIRDNNEIELPVDPKFTGLLSSQKNKGIVLFSPRFIYDIDSVNDDSPASKAGLQKDDVIIGVNDVQSPWRKDIVSEVVANAGKAVNLSVLRNNTDTLALMANIGEDGRLGIYTKSIDLASQKYSIMQAIPKGISKSVDFLTGQLKAFGQMFKGRIDARESLGSVISIAKEFGPTWEWQRFWGMTASLSILLGFLNLLPIPGLDGGHVMFLLYEVVSGRKPSDKVVEYSTIGGFILLVLLMIFALGLDISRLF